MLKNYLNAAWRNLSKNKFSSFINISGLAVGMAVAILIGLWIWDEMSYNKDNKNYHRISQVLQNLDFNNEIVTWRGAPYPLAAALRKDFKDDFKAVSLVNWATSILSYHQKPLSQPGLYMEPQAPEMLDLKMLQGSHEALTDPNSILLSASAAAEIFGSENPLNKIINVENVPAKVTGIFKNMPANSTFSNVSFLAAWELKLKIVPALRTMENPWGGNPFHIYVQLADNANMESVSAKIKDEKIKYIRAQERNANPRLFLHPMSKWYLYDEFKNGFNTGGRIQFVWWFGIIGAFVLLLACINFMNLSTARSEKRAKEVGIRKSVGSLRSQLISQFLGESVLVSFFSLLVSLLLVVLCLPLFNNVADKQVTLPWTNFYFWLCLLTFSFLTGIIAGSYPAFYLSGFNPVKVLKGTFTAGRFSAIPRKALVVLQFSVSVVLIIGTVVIFRQIQFARNRPLGYNNNGLLMVSMHLFDIRSHFDALRNDLVKSGAVLEMADAGNPITEVYNSNSGMSWKGKVPGSTADFPMSAVSADYGRTVGWQIIEGRDFSRDFPSDSAAFLLNESAVKFMGLKNPVGEKVTFNDGVAFTVIGVIRDFVMKSPYDPVRPSLFRMTRGSGGGILTLKLNPAMSAHDALNKAESIFKKYNPEQPFEYKFADEEYAKKFSVEERVGRLAGIFAALAIFISCLGLFGLAAYMAEQRTKEIGVRKVLGATIFNVWTLLSKDFLLLVIVSLLIAIPLGYYLMDLWLQNYSYRTHLPWWIFAAAGASALMITLFTVSFQSIKAGVTNPLKSLRTE